MRRVLVLTILENLAWFALAWCLVIGVPAAHSHDLNEQHKAMIISSWQPRISQHLKTDPQLAQVETDLMQAQLKCNSAECQRLMAVYMEMQAQRNPSVAAQIRTSLQMFQQAEYLKATIAADYKAGKIAQARLHQRQLLELARVATPAVH